MKPQSHPFLLLILFLTMGFASFVWPLPALCADGVYQTLADVKNNMPDPDKGPNSTQSNRDFILFNYGIIQPAGLALVQSGKAESALTDDDKWLLSAYALNPGTLDLRNAALGFAPHYLQGSIYALFNLSMYDALKTANYQWNGADLHFLSDTLALKFADFAAMNPNRAAFVAPSSDIFHDDNLRVPEYKSMFSTLVAGKDEPTQYVVVLGEIASFTALGTADAAYKNKAYNSIMSWLTPQRDFMYRNMKAHNIPIPTPAPTATPIPAQVKKQVSRRP